MDRFKQAMGFLMMATVVWLLSVLGSQIGPEGIVWTLAFLTVVAFACWLIGIGFDLSATHRKRAITGVAALVLLILGYIYFPGRHLAALETVAAESAPEAVVKTTGKIHWQPFSIDLIEKLAAENKTIFVDFTADWCTTCKVNEHGALATDAVQDAFIAHDVEAVVGDWTKPNEDIRRVLREFGRSGVPLYVIFPAGNPGEPIVLPDGVITSSMVVEALRKASGKTS
ncbi:thioredoxin family protein [Candidatus Sumerlaeota bacterium]|nr:thioredoxin family protein [Candidatus Sumerlaeota bacterium]